MPMTFLLQLKLTVNVNVGFMQIHQRQAGDVKVGVYHLHTFLPFY